MYPPDRALPLDTYDWIGSHIIGCMQIGGQLRPVFSYKFVELHTCEQFGLPFNGQTPFQRAAPQHAAAIDEILKQVRDQNRTIAYFSSWTIDPDFRKLPEAKALHAEAAIGIQVHLHQTLGINEALCLGAEKVKAHVLQQRAGFELLKGGDGQLLESTVIPTLLNEKAFGLHLKEFSAEALQLQLIRPAWEKRLELGVYKVFAHPHKKKAA